MNRLASVSFVENEKNLNSIVSVSNLGQIIIII